MKKLKSSASEHDRLLCLSFREFLRQCRDAGKDVDTLENRVRNMLSVLHTKEEIDALTYGEIEELLKASVPTGKTLITVKQRILQLHREGFAIFQGAT